MKEDGILKVRVKTFLKEEGRESPPILHSFICVFMLVSMYVCIKEERERV